MKPTISVIIPAYNAGMTIERAVRSALRSRDGFFFNVDVVVCDDGSTDATAARAEAAGAKVIRQANAGPSAALNAAAAAANGEYLFILEADDWIEDGALIPLFGEVAYGLDFAYGATKYWGQRSGLYKPPKFDPGDFYERNVSLYAVLWRRKAWEDGVQWHTFRAGYGYQDWDLLLQMVDRRMRGASLPEVTVLNYVYKPGSLNGQMKAREDEFIAELRERHPKMAERLIV